MFWPKSNAELILPPTRRKKHGRPQKEMRREELEGPKKSKMSRVGRVMKCSICRLEEDDFHGGYQTLTRISTSPRALRQKKKKRTLKQLFSPKRRPRGRPRKRRRPEEENESLVADAKFNNSKTRKRVLETRSVAFVGRYVLKEFGRRAFLGKIVSYDTGLYRVDYEDGDFEDLESGELRELILEETNFDDNLSRRKVRLDELVLNRIVKESELEEKKKKLEVLKNEVDGVETSSVSKLVVENDGEQDKDGADSSSDSCEHANDRELSLESEIPLIPPPILPPSSGTIGVPEECVSHLFSVYGFLRRLRACIKMLEYTFADPNSKEFSTRNVIPRVVSRSLSVVISTTVAAMLPFFGDINAVIGAFGFRPLDFILPVVFFNLTFKPSKRSLVFWLNVTIAVVFSALGVIAAVAAVRRIALDAKNYRLFANV
ncbi:hypothetical protein V6N13_058606 [Hibiscus sabdariffa]